MHGARGGTSAPNVPGAASDLLAPVNVSNLTATPGVNQIVWSWDQSPDLHDGVTAASGSKEYDLSLNGSVTTVTAPAALATSAFTTRNTGAVTQSASQSGNTWTVTSTGANGIDGTDQFTSIGLSVSGDFTAKARIVSLTGATTPDWALGGIIVHETTAQDSKLFACYRMRLTLTSGLQCKDRKVTAGGYANLAQADGVSGPAWIKITRVGQVLTASYSFDNVSWLQLYAETLSMTSSVLVDMLVTSYSGNAVTAVIEDFAVAPTVIRASYTQSIAYPATVTAKVRARDLAAALNTTAYSAVVTASPLQSTPPPAGYIKWHPGHGIGAGITNSSNTDASVAAIFDNVRFEDNFKFCHIVLTWRHLEPTQGNYDFSRVRQWRDYCNNTTIPGRFSTPKRLSLEIFWMVFGNESVSTGTQAMPQYIIDAGWYGNCADFSRPCGVFNNIADLRYSGALNALKALYAALAVEFDTDPSIEQIAITESSNQYDAPLKSLSLSVKQSFVHTNVVLMHNYTFVPKDVSDYLISIGVGAGGPDIIPTGTGETDGQLAFRGGLSGSVDGRGITPNYLANEVKESQRGCPAALLAYASSQKVTHLAWWPEEGFTPACLSWSTPSTGVKATVNANPNTLYTTCPTAYAGTCVSP